MDPTKCNHLFWNQTQVYRVNNKSGKVTHKPSTGASLVRNTRLVSTALCCNSVIPFIKWEEMVVYCCCRCLISQKKFWRTLPLKLVTIGQIWSQWINFVTFEKINAVEVVLIDQISKKLHCRNSTHWWVPCWVFRWPRGRLPLGQSPETSSTLILFFYFLFCSSETYSHHPANKLTKKKKYRYSIAAAAAAGGAAAAAAAAAAVSLPLLPNY